MQRDIVRRIEHLLTSRRRGRSNDEHVHAQTRGYCAHRYVLVNSGGKSAKHGYGSICARRLNRRRRRRIQILACEGQLHGCARRGTSGAVVEVVTRKRGCEEKGTAAFVRHAQRHQACISHPWHGRQEHRRPRGWRC